MDQIRRGVREIEDRLASQDAHLDKIEAIVRRQDAERPIERISVFLLGLLVGAMANSVGIL